MKTNWVFLGLFLLSLQPLQAQIQARTAYKTSLIYGKVSRKIPFISSSYEVPASKVKVLLMEMANPRERVDKSFCNRNDYGTAVQVFITDSRGEYHFKTPKKGKNYRLIFCDVQKGKVYFTDLQVPTSGTGMIKVPDQKIN